MKRPTKTPLQEAIDELSDARGCGDQVACHRGYIDDSDVLRTGSSTTHTSRRIGLVKLDFYH
jgi:hypothetical protein